MPNSDEKDATHEAILFFREHGYDPKEVLRQLVNEPISPDVWVFCADGDLISVNAQVRYNLVTSLLAALAADDPILKGPLN